MKIYFSIILIAFLGVFNTNAQETIKSLKDDLPSASDLGDIYYKDITNTLDKYLETWLYDDGTYYFKATFIKRERERMGATNTYFDKLVCEYTLKISGEVIYDTYGANSNIDTPMANHIIGSNIDAENVVNLYYTEPSINGECRRFANGKLKLEYLPGLQGTTPQLNWTRVNNLIYGNTTECADGTQMDTFEFKIPASMTLIKQ